MIFGTRLFLRCLLHYNNSHTRFVLLLNFVLLYIHLQNGDISDRKQFEEVCKAFESLSPGKKKCLHDRKHLLIRITLIKLKSVFLHFSVLKQMWWYHRISNPNLACFTCVTKIYYAFSYTRLISVIFHFFRVQKRLNQTRLWPSKFNVTSLKKCQKGKLPFNAANCMLPTHIPGGV